MISLLRTWVQRRTLDAFALIAVMLMTLLLGTLRPTFATANVTVVVLPFANSTSEGRFDALRSGFADLLASALSRHDTVTVVDREHLVAIADKLGLSLATEESRETAPRVGHLLGANLVIKGGFTYVNRRLTVNVHAFDVETRALVHSTETSGPLDELAELSATLARDLARGLSARLEPRTELAADPTPALSLHFMRGMSYYYHQLFDHAVAEFMQLLSLDPINDEARFWIAKSYLDGDAPDHARIELKLYLEEFPQGPRAAEAEALLAAIDEQH